METKDENDAEKKRTYKTHGVRNTCASKMLNKHTNTESSTMQLAQIESKRHVLTKGKFAYTQKHASTYKRTHTCANIIKIK